ncbi:LacI family DNA-binding transcriptional regulator [Auraticoccus monumenti]|uniref:LacI family DNA-binding transcriptional regulator n=1 Tax=Auraticoccus monumenti TaxID=675864 RepID=UPI0018D3D406|nr:LacI family DNA-binding transcriptional regulator [Auraticoccus monumenti]
MEVDTPVGDAADRAPTLADVAAGAGVAVSTVSRALSHPARVNVTTRHRIERVAEQLGYVRPGSAPSNGGTGLAVAVLLPDTNNPFFVDLLRGVQRELKARGRHLLLIDTENSAALDELALSRVRGICDGAVVLTPRLSEARLDALEHASMPLVTVNRPRRSRPSVVIDAASGFGQAVEHLVSMGHRRLVYVSGPRTNWSTERRWRTVARSAERLGVEVSRTGPHPPVRAAGTGAAEAVINSGATGVLVFNDMIAISMLQRFAERSIRIPDDLSVVGCDDVFAAACCHPALTTISSPAEQAGRVAVSLLLGGDVDESRSVLLPTHLVVRGSTGPAPA